MSTATQTTEQRIRNQLGDKPVHIDEIAHGAGLSVREVQAGITTLELGGDIKDVGRMHFVLTKPVAPPKAKREPTARPPARESTISHEDMEHLLAGLELRAEAIAERVDRGSAELESMKETLDPRIAKLTALIPRTKEGASEITHITKGQYRKVWGREPKPNVLTASGKSVRWEYALDELAQELGLEHKARDTGMQPDEYLKHLIEEAAATKREISALTYEIDADQRTLKSLERLKVLVQSKAGDTTSVELVESFAKSKPKVRSKSGRAAQKMLADEAWKLIKKVQAGRSLHAIAMDSERKADRILPLSQAHIWARSPNRYDIRGVDTPTHKRRKMVPRRGRKPRATPQKSVSVVR